MRRGFEAVTAVLLAVMIAALIVAVALPLTPAFLTRTVPLQPQTYLPSVAAPPSEQDGQGSTTPAAPSRDAVASALADRFARPATGVGQLSGTVVDVVSGQALFSADADLAGVPASSLKTLTAAAALSVLGEDARRSTEVRFDGRSVVLVGGGDVLLTQVKLKQLAAEAAEAIMAQADERTESGDSAETDETAESGEGGTDEGATDEARAALTVVLDDTLFDGGTLSPHWDESLMTGQHIAPVMPIALHAGYTSADSDTRASDPGMSAALAFHQALAAELDGTGVPLGGDVVRGAAPEGAEEVAAAASPTIGEMVRVMTEDSENYVAEVLGRLVALESGQPASFGGVSNALTAAAERMGVNTEGMRIVDASGLAAANHVTPAQLAGVMSSAAVSADGGLRELPYVLPIAGATGTMAGRLDGDATRGKVRAKTGTLTGVVTLTGYVVTQDGALLAFSFFARDVPGALGPARDALDDAAAALAAL